MANRNDHLMAGLHRLHITKPQPMSMPALTPQRHFTPTQPASAAPPTLWQRIMRFFHRTP